MADNTKVYEVKSFRGGISDYEDKGVNGAFKFGKNLEIRDVVDCLKAGYSLYDIGTIVDSISASVSPSGSLSPSASGSPSVSASISPSSSHSPSPPDSSSSRSPSASLSPSGSLSPSASLSPSHSTSPSPSPAAGLLSVFTDLILTFVKATDGMIYGFGNTGKIYKINPDDDGVYQVYNAGQRITGAWEFPTSSGKSYMYFATRTNLHRKELPGRADWNDVNEGSWPKTNLTDNDWHTMREAGGALVIANASTLAMVGYDESYTNNALDLIPGNLAKTIVERNGHTIVGTAREADLNRSVNGAIDCEVPLAQVGTDGELYFADMTNGMPVKRFPGGGQVNPGGVANLIDQVNFFEWEQNALSWIDKQAVGNMSLWGVYSADTGYGGVYSYGRKNKNHPFVLNLEYELDVTEIGALVSVGGIVYASYHDGSDYGVKRVDTSVRTTATYEGLDFKAPVKKPINITTWLYAEVFMQPLPSNCSVEFWYKMNKTGSFIRAYNADGTTNYATPQGKKAVFRLGAEGQIFEPRLVLVPSGSYTPEVYRIRIYFQ
jgi:hypothetical protein